MKKIKERTFYYVKQAKVKLVEYIKTNILFSTFVITSVLNSTLLRFFTVKNYFDMRPILADFSVVLLIGAFGYFLKPKNQFKYFFSWSVFFTLICIINSMYYTNYLSFVSASLLATSLQLKSVGDAVIQNVMELKDFSYIWQLVAIFFVNRALKRNHYYDKVAKIEKGKIRALNTLVAGLITLGFFISMLNSVDISRLGKQWNREFIVMRFGLYTYQANDLVASIKPQISPLFGYDEKAKAFREYYASNENKNEKNKYTNIFKGKNVIVIHAESMQTFLLNTSFNGEEVTPTLKKLASEGLYFSNFYAQDSVGTSSDSEFTFNTSLMPTTSGTVFVNYWDREYITIPKLLKEQGYYTFSMHGNNGSMWNRNVVHPKLGYDYFFNYSKDFELDEKLGLGLTDKSFFRQAVPKIKKISEENQNFYGTLIMLTNHTPFNDKGKAYSDFEVDYKYETINEETGETEIVSAPYMEGTKLGNYFKSAHYADEALNQFIEDLDAAGLLDNTVLVIYGDHDAKLKKSEYDRFYNYDPKTNRLLSADDPEYKKVDFYQYELNRKVPFIIWTKDHKYKEEVQTVMGMYDVLPTLGNMFGFHSSYALGHDIFSVDENVVVFPDGNWLTNKMYYNAQKGAWLSLHADEPVSIDYTNYYTKHAEDVISISDSIIIYDLIKKTTESEDLLKKYNNG